MTAKSPLLSYRDDASGGEGGRGVGAHGQRGVPVPHVRRVQGAGRVGRRAAGNRAADWLSAVRGGVPPAVRSGDAQGYRARRASLPAMAAHAARAQLPRPVRGARLWRNATSHRQ
eukprot:1052158-Prorocentrum_minimum.AAC.1